jgi:cyclase
MDRPALLALLIVFNALAALAQAPRTAPAPSAAGLRAEKIRDNMYVLRGGGLVFNVGGVDLPQAGTTLAFVTANGVVLVDTKMPGWGTAIIEKLKEITGKPVTMIINTHTHVDHVGGNTEFPATVDVIAHENTAALMREMRPVSGGPVQPNIFKDSNGRGLPKRTFRDRMTIGSGVERIELHYFGRAHTSGDAWVVFPALRVVHAGDVFGNKVVPLLDLNNGASGVEYPQTIARAVEGLSNVDTLISGHYQTAMTIADLKTYGEFVGEWVRAVQTAKAAGRTIDEFMAGWKIPERFAAQGYISTEQLRSSRPDVEAVWNETK